MDISSIEKRMKVPERFISVSAMLSKGAWGKRRGHRALKKRICLLTVLLSLFLLPITPYPLPGIVCAEIIDRVVAFIDDEAITLTEFMEYYEKARELTPELSRKEAINTLINRRLLLREAKRLRLRGESDDELIREYVDIKIRTYIRISPEEIERFYNTHRERFGKTSIENVRNDIERLLRERKVNKRLQKHIEKLREKSYIKINFLP